MHCVVFAVIRKRDRSPERVPGTRLSGTPLKDRLRAGANLWSNDITRRRIMFRRNAVIGLAVTLLLAGSLPAASAQRAVLAEMFGASW